jgi:hypothetical protein
VAKFAIYSFVIIFCAIGIGLIYGAFGVFQDGETTNAFLMVVAGLAFGGFGVAVLVLTGAGLRTQEREETLRGAHPDEPWMWREDWVAGRIPSTEKDTALFFWVFAIIWNLISTPLVVFLPNEIVEKENYAALLGLLFPLVGIGLLVTAARKTIQKRKYGDCIFVMERMPGILGGDVAGTLHVPRGLTAGVVITVQLSSIHRQRQHSGKDTTTREEVLWKTDQTDVRLSPVAAGLGGTVGFKVPYDASPTGVMDEDNSIVWRLSASAAVPGVDFSATFDIPVFKTRASSPQVTEERLRSEVVAARPAPLSPAGHPDVDILAGAGGGKEFLLKPRGGLRTNLPGIAFILVFGGIGALITLAGAPFLFTIIFGGIAAFLAFALIFGLFGESRILVEEGHVSVRNSLFGIMWGHRMPCGSITKVHVKGEGSQGKTGSFSIVFTQEGAKTTSPFQSVRTQAEGDWLADEVCKAMEPWRQEKGAGRG